MPMIKVRAKSFGQKPDMGFANRGDEFEIPESKFSARWMEKVKDSATAEAVDIIVRAKAPAKAKAKAEAEAKGDDDKPASESNGKDSGKVDDEA